MYLNHHHLKFEDNYNYHLPNFHHPHNVNQYYYHYLLLYRLLHKQVVPLYLFITSINSDLLIHFMHLALLSYLTIESNYFLF